MTETSTEIEPENKCANCGAEIRSASQFCYGCGKPVTASVEDEETNVVVFPVRASEEQDEEPEEFLAAAADAAEDEADAAKAEMPAGFLVPEEEAPAPQAQEKAEQLPGSLPPERTRNRERRRKNERLETAAAIQKRERLRVKKPDEVVWAQTDPTWIFAAVAVGLLVISALIFYFAVMDK